MKVASCSLVMMFARASTGLTFPARPFRALALAARGGAVGGGVPAAPVGVVGAASAVAPRHYPRTLTAMAASVVSRPAGLDLSEPPVKHAAFELVRDEMVEEYGVRASLYKHVKSGAEVLSVVADDENKVFGITFRTPPKDSTGVPHILEHSVLCGSRKYESKEPFVELLKGSLQTFLNAFTYPDRTCYPVASCNLKDFYNLVNVYLDAVLHPRAMQDPLVLKQEGWHLELDAPDAPLTYKGVVYNEMKGVYSSPDSVLGRAAQQALFRDNTYAVDSGGDPLVIPELTFEGFKAFHGEFYHPSNSRVFFYGDDPVAARLDLLDEYLAEFDAIEPDSAVGIEPKRDLVTELQGRRVVEKFPAAPTAEGSEDKAQNMVQVNWLLNEAPFSPKEQLALAVLDHLLMGTSAATLRKALTDSGLGAEVIGGGLSDELSQATFAAGLKGVKPEDADAVEALVLSTLAAFAEAGPEQDAVDASLNSMEFMLREFNTGSFPRGLSFMLGAMSQWLFDRDPLAGLRFEAPLQELKDDLKAGKPVFSELVKTLLLENPHRVGVEMVPDPSLEAAQVAEEAGRLAALKAQMSAAEVAQVMAETAELKAAQAAHDTPAQLATIPQLGLDDLSPEQLELPNEVASGEGGCLAVLRHEVPSNGILYVDLGLDLTVLDADELPLVSLLSRALTATGTALGDEVALSRRIGAKTGGLGASSLTGIKTPADDSVATGDDLVHRLFLRGKVVMSRPEDLFEISLDVLTTAQLGNKKRLVEMLKESEARVEAAMVSSGHSYASTRLAAASTLAGALGEATGGAASLATVRGLLAQAEADFPALQARLEAMRAKLLDKKRLLVNLSGDKATLAAAQPALDAFLAAFPEKNEGGGGGGGGGCQLGAWKGALAPLPATNEGFVVPTQVNYVGKGGRLYAPGEKVTGASMVVSRALRTGYLWDTVRVMGGAYGGFCRFSPLTGTFAYLSYRDPNLLGTLANYDGAPGFLASTGGAELTNEALAQAIIGAVGDLDGPLSPDAKGYEAMRRWLVEESPAQRAAWRAEVMATTRADFEAFGARLAAAHEAAGEGAGMHSVVFGSKQALEDANAELAKAGKPLFVLKELL